MLSESRFLIRLPGRKRKVLRKAASGQPCKSVTTRVFSSDRGKGRFFLSDSTDHRASLLADRFLSSSSSALTAISDQTLFKMNETPAARFLRQPGDSSLPFNLASLSQSLLSSSDLSSTSPSEYDSTSPSLVSYSSSGSPASSIASSPALRPKLLPALSSATDDFSPLSTSPSRSDSITTSQLPSTTDLSVYAASIIRNEAYALLSLAARLSPASQPIVSDEELDSASSESSSVEGLGFDEDTHPSRRQSISGPSGLAILQESRTNVAFRQVVDLIRDMPAHGKVLVTGIGKSGIAGKKMVATFCSLGKSDFDLLFPFRNPI